MSLSHTDRKGDPLRYGILVRHVQDHQPVPMRVVALTADEYGRPSAVVTGVAYGSPVRVADLTSNFVRLF